MNKSLSFVFKGYNSDLDKGEILFNFGLKGEKNIDFREKISFPPVKSQIPQDLLKSILNSLMLILGISYWKLYCPKEIIIESNFLNKEQAEFWNKVYKKGLGEFFYKNKIDFRGLVNFPYVENPSNSTSLSTPVKQASSSFQSSAPRENRSLLGVGGGKDSVVAAELLKSQNKEFDLFTLETSHIQEEVASAIGKKPIIIKRELDSKLFNFNEQEGTYNGHVPISAIYAFLGLLASVLYDYNSIVVGNEKSANYGNIEYLGEMINHQWSKSEKFEKLFNDYVQEYITKDVLYSSPLRNMSELQVVQEFVKYPKYFKVFSSCNANFRINKPFDSAQGLRWCGKCAKCLFVFICLAAFFPKAQVLDIFGKNLFEDKNLLPLFEEILGIKNFKPFECVGTPEEVKEALGKILARGEFNNTILMKHPRAGG